MTRAKELGELLRVAGYSVKPTLMHDDFDGRDGQAIWEVTVERAGERHTFTFHNAVVNRRFKNGSVMRPHHIGPVISTTQLEENLTSRPNRPTYADCIYSLLVDAGYAVTSDFEAFCDELGYSENRGRAAWKGCEDAKAGLDRLGADYDELHRIFEDY